MTNLPQKSQHIAKNSKMCSVVAILEWAKLAYFVRDRFKVPSISSR